MVIIIRNAGVFKFIMKMTWQDYYFVTDTQNDFKIQELPLARIKKIMKQDEEVKVGCIKTNQIYVISMRQYLLFA